MRRSLVCLLVIGLASCTDPAGPTSSTPVNLSFPVHLTGIHPAFQAEGLDGAIAVLGTFEALCVPYGAVGSADRDENEIVLRVTGKAGDACFPATQSVRYAAQIENVPAGNYHLRVVHHWDGTDRDGETKFTVDVVVE